MTCTENCNHCIKSRVCMFKKEFIELDAKYKRGGAEFNPIEVKIKCREFKLETEGVGGLGSRPCDRFLNSKPLYKQI